MLCVNCRMAKSKTGRMIPEPARALGIRNTGLENPVNRQTGMSALLLPDFDSGEQALEAVVQRGIAFRMEDLAKVRDGIRYRADGFGQRSGAGVGVAAALEFLGDLQCFPVTTAKADDDRVGGATEQSDEHG